LRSLGQHACEPCRKVLVDAGFHITTAAAAAQDDSQRPASRLKHNLLLWSLFFLICLGLGYPSLKRYSPRTTEGLSDTIIYYQMIAGEPSGRARADIFRCRVLVPYVAKPFYKLALSHLHSIDPAVFALLIANALFCATTTVLLSNVGYGITRDPAVALLAATIYLLNFDILNLQLAGIIDSGESCLLLAVVWTLLAGRWRLLPLWGILGPLAKETFVPFSCILMLVWWLSSERAGPQRYRKLGWIAATVILSIMMLVMTRLLLIGYIVWPWNIAAQMDSRTNYLSSLWRCISDHNFWYVFGWLLPLGIWRLKQLPRAWVLASACMALTALLFGTYSDMQGTVARPIFNTVGPLLSLSVALLLARSFKSLNDKDYQLRIRTK
jgi:uncharacterized membrane protein